MRIALYSSLNSRMRKSLAYTYVYPQIYLGTPAILSGFKLHPDFQTDTPVTNW